jgi:hypothetical protein
VNGIESPAVPAPRLHRGVVAGRTAASRALREVEHLVVHSEGGVGEDLPNVLWLELGVFAQKLMPIGVRREQLENAGR